MATPISSDQPGAPKARKAQTPPVVGKALAKAFARVFKGAAKGRKSK